MEMCRMRNKQVMFVKQATVEDVAAADGPASANLNAQWYGLHLSVNGDW